MAATTPVHVTNPLTPLQAYLQNGRASDENETDAITDIGDYWRKHEFGGENIGLIRDQPPRSPPDYIVGAFYVHKEIKNSLREWKLSLGTTSELCDGFEATAVSRLSPVLSRHDRRFLWRVLLRGIEDADTHKNITDTESSLCSVLVQAVCQCHPELAFRSSESWFEGEDGSNLGYKAPVEKCIASRNAAFLLKPLLAHKEAIAWLTQLYNRPPNDKSPLIAALQVRNKKAVQILLEENPQSIYDGAVGEIMNFGKRRGRGNESALMEIAQWIISRFPDLKVRWFEAALATKNIELIELYYAPEVLFIEDVIKTLIELTEMDDEKLLMLVGFKDACHNIKIVDTDRLLHLAVKARRVKLTEYLAENTNGAFTRDVPNSPEETEGHYALWYNNRHGLRPRDDLVKESAWGEIRKSIILRIIRSCEPEMIDEIIHESDDKIGEYSFDLSDFDAHSIRFHDFLDAFMGDEQHKTRFHGQLEFETHLKYVQFPNLPSDFNDLAVEYDEIDRVFKWLWKKGVREILQLIVPDRLWGSHSEKMIAKWVASFRIEILNWRCQDLSFTHLSSKIKTEKDSEECAIDTIKEIYLYSSGKSAVHQYWLGQHGLINFPRIRRVYIYVIEDFLPKPLFTEAMAELTRESERLQKELRQKGIKDAYVRPLRYSSLVRRKVIRGDTLHDITTRAFKDLSQFLDLYRHLDLKKKTRVAIIDNGIMATSRNTNYPDLSNNDVPESRIPGSPQYSKVQGNILEHIVDGETFVHAGGHRRSSWFVAADPHGSQMAALICALDPLCEVLIAKVAERRSDIFPDRVAKAIRWATRKDVDIISMSFVCDKSDNLMGAITEAQVKNILMFSSCHDEGFNKTEAFPAHSPHTLAIAACGQQGDLIYNIPDDDYQYRFRGRDVFVGRVAQLDSRDTITGSSVATATAAGMASLILSCLRFCDKPKPGASPAPPPGERRTAPGRMQNNQASVTDEADEPNELVRVLTNGIDHAYPLHAQPSAPTLQPQPPANDAETSYLVLPENTPYSDWRRTWVQHYFGRMAPTDKKYVALDRFCDLHKLELEEVNFKRTVVRRWFCSSTP